MATITLKSPDGTTETFECESDTTILDALEEAKQYLNNCSYREVARWLSLKTGRTITHTGLRKIINKRWTSHHLNQNKTSEENEE